MATERGCPGGAAAERQARGLRVLGIRRHALIKANVGNEQIVGLNPSQDCGMRVSGIHMGEVAPLAWLLEVLRIWLRALCVGAV